jgi:CUE domain
MQDSDVIEEILRINRGSVERTIDQLLAIAGDNQVNNSWPASYYFLICFFHLE